MKGIIYRVTHRKSGKKYYGQTIRSLSERKRDHYYSVENGSSYHFHNAIRKYGEDAFDWEIIEECNSENLLEREAHYIDLDQTLNSEFGFNLKKGGIQGTLSLETRKKISKALKGKKLSKKHRENISKGNKGNKLTEKHKKKISKKLKELVGEKHPHFGVKRSEKTRERMREAAKKRTYDEVARESFRNAQKRMKDDKFKEIWNSSKSLEEVRNRTGYAASTVYGKVAFLRREGHSMKDLPKWDDSDFRKAVKDILQENRTNTLKEYGDEFGATDLGNFADFRKVFFEPFTDVLNTAKGSLAKVSSKAWKAVETVAKGIPSLVVPFLSTNYDQIFAREEQRQQAIERKYADVFNRARSIWQGEAGKIAFMLNPVLMMTEKVSEVGAKESLDLADALSGFDPDVRARTSRARQDLGLGESISLGQSLIMEGDAEDVVMDLFNDQEFQTALKQSRVVKDIINSAQAMKNESLNALKDIAQKIAEVRTPEDAERLFRRAFNTSVIDRLPDDLKQQATNSLLASIKVSSLRSIADTLQMQLNELEEIDIPEASDLVSVYQRVLNDVNELIRR